MAEQRKIDVRIHDAQIHFWQEDANDESFREDVFIGVLKTLGRRGWAIGPDAETAKRFPSLKRHHRSGRKAELLMNIRISGRVVGIEIWADNYEGGNRHGNRYGFDKLKRMPIQTRRRVEATHHLLVNWAQRSFQATVSRGDLRPPQIPAAEYIARQYAESCHRDKTLGRPINSPANSRSGDDGLIEQGVRVWFRGRDGRARRGTAYYSLNNMWFVVENRDTLHCMSSRELLLAPPADLRRKLNPRRRRERLEAELARATRIMDFRRAELLRRILFGEEAPLLIWSKKNNAFYASNYCGYTTDQISAGKYRAEEAFAEVDRVSQHLIAMTLDGRQISRPEARQ